MRIDVWSDLVCPWCYIGKRRLEHALQDFAHRDAVEVVYRSFQLNPSAPAGETSSRRQMLMSKYGRSAAQAAELDARMEQTAARAGLEYHLTADGVTGNTFDAHRLLQLSRDRGRQDEVLERFFRAYFTEQRSLFDRESLMALSAEAGLAPAEVGRVLDDDEYADSVRRDNQQAQSLGATGVPFYVFDGRYGVSGAQPAEIFGDVLSRAWAATA